MAAILKTNRKIAISPQWLDHWHEIWHDDASRPSKPHSQLKFWTVKNPRWQTVAILKNRKMAISQNILTFRVNCWQNKTEGPGNTVSGCRQVPGTDAAVTTAIDGQLRPRNERPPTERPPGEPTRHPWQRPLQPRQAAVDEFCPPNPDALVLGFRRHRMMSQQQAVIPAVNSRQVRKKRVCDIFHCNMSKHCPIMIFLGRNVNKKLGNQIRSEMINRCMR